jgi:calcineurin-like phosphoesterase family protein
MSTTWLTSDSHLGHERVAEIRGFANVKDHDDAWVNTWLSQVAWNDQVYILGDFTGRDKDIPNALRILDSLPGTKHLVNGNHDPSHSSRTESIKWTRTYLEHFASVADLRVLKVEGRRVHLSHFPVVTGDGHDDRGEVRWADYRLPTGLSHPVCHGHLHSEVKEHGNQMHCGIDSWGRFVSLGEVAQWVRGLNETGNSSTNSKQSTLTPISGGLQTGGTDQATGILTTPLFEISSDGSLTYGHNTTERLAA